MVAIQKGTNLPQATTVHVKGVSGTMVDAMGDFERREMKVVFLDKYSNALKMMARINAASSGGEKK